MTQKVDLLLGAELFYDLLREGKFKLTENLFLQPSCFGYLVSGSVKQDIPFPVNRCFLATTLESLNKTLTSFWETENLLDDNNICDSDELKYCVMWISFIVAGR